MLEASPVEGRDAYWELFDDELPEIGIAAVWVKIHNTREGAIDLTHLRWRFGTGGRNFSSLNADQLLKRFYKGRRIRLYTLSSEQRARRDLEKVLFENGPLAPSGTRQGFVFLGIDPSLAKTWSRGGKLVAADIRLEDHKKIQIELLFNHANP